MTSSGSGGEAQLASSRGARTALLVAGHVLIALGVIGAFVPVMPTTVFLILAASCYARASTRFYNRLLDHATFGPLVRDWREHRAMSVRAKAAAIAAIVPAFLVTGLLFLSNPWARTAFAALGIALVTWILWIRTRP